VGKAGGVTDIATMLDALGLPPMIHEPEVLAADLARIQCKTLAGIIAELIADNEPLLKAEADGPTVTVRELGGPLVMRFTVEAQ
jgi:hypothetical protein